MGSWYLGDREFDKKKKAVGIHENQMTMVLF